jgi:outer membrane protein OmpA-like peptidoglycan-associated protein
VTGREALRRFARRVYARVRRWLGVQKAPAVRPRSPEEIREYKARMRAALAAHVRANAARAAALARVNASNPAPAPPRAPAIAPPPTPAARAYAAAVGGEIRASMRAAGSPGDDPHWLAALAPLVAADRAAAAIRAAHDAGNPPAQTEPAADSGDTLEPSELGARDRDDGSSGGGGRERQLSLLQAVLIALLAAGAADLLVLNLWAVPQALQETSISAARKTQPRATTPPARSTMPAPRPALAPPPLVPPPSAAPAAPPERLGFVLFRYGDFWVGPKSHATLLEMLPRMAADRRPIHLIGHADAHGTPSVNRRISEARAHAVARVLIEDGVAEDRIRISGVGSDGQDESALARRVELQLEDMP